MNKTIILLLFSTLFSGCVSATIVGYGKRYESLLEPSTSVDDVRNELGDASWSKEYHPALAICNTPEFIEHAKNITPFDPFIWDGNEVSKERLASYCEVYTREGPFYNMERGQAYGMIGALTLGLGDILLLPSAIIKRYELSNKKFSLTFWYDENKKFIGYFQGDINSQNDDRFPTKK